MDHISKALEKAKSETERQSVRDWVNPSEHIAQKSVGQYSGNVVKIDSDYVRENHILSGPGHENPAIADRYRLLRTRTLQLMKPKKWATLGITSAGPKAGKSLTSMNLAITIARSSDRKVVLVDADLRKPSIASDMGFEVTHGLIDYLSSDVDLDDVLVRIEGLDNLTILPGRDIEEGLNSVTPELLNSTKMSNLINKFMELDPSALVVVDLPPVLVGDDVIAQASHLQCVLVVVEEGGTTVDELRECAELLSKLNILGTVLNKSSEEIEQFEGYYQINPQFST